MRKSEFCMKRDRRRFTAADNGNDLAKPRCFCRIDKRTQQFASKAFAHLIGMQVDAVFAGHHIGRTITKRVRVGIARYHAIDLDHEEDRLLRKDFFDLRGGLREGGRFNFECSRAGQHMMPINVRNGLCVR
jgi:hypothetical protein